MFKDASHENMKISTLKQPNEPLTYESTSLSSLDRCYLVFKCISTSKNKVTCIPNRNWIEKIIKYQVLNEYFVQYYNLIESLE